MNIAVILAGGSGTRTNYAVPKQFLTINDIPVIIYTMLNVQKVQCIDEIIVMIPHGWNDFVETYAKQYEITKLRGVFEGGDSRHMTVLKAIEHLKSCASSEDKIILLEANRPLIPQQVIENAIAALDYSPAVLAVDPCYDSMYISENGTMINSCVDRSILYKGQMPEAARMGTISEILSKAALDGIEQTPIALFLRYGVPVHHIMGSPLSFKITTSEDMEILKALITHKERK